MFKKILVIIIVLLTINIWFANYIWNDETKQIYTQDKGNVINDNWLNDPIRNGTLSSSKHLEWIAKTDESSEENRQKWFMNYIAIWVNYILWFLGLIVIILIIKDGIIMITSAWNEEKRKEAFKNLKNYIIALILIWAWYLIVNLVFYIVNENTKSISYKQTLIHKV